MKYIRLFLLPFSVLYWLVIFIRNWFFEIGILKTTKVNVPVISVGNISAGGTGKTQIVEMLIEKLQSSHQLAVVSRGYGRKSTGTIVVNDGAGNLISVEDAGDEASQLVRKFSNLIVVVDEKRVRGAQRAIELGASLILLDDGFQHRYIHRDLNIVVMTTQDVLKGDRLLPAGNKREPINSLKRSDLIIISRCKSENEFARSASKLESFGKPVIGTRTKVKSIKRISTKASVGVEYFAGKKVVAFSGIGNPKSFDFLLSEAKVKVEKHLVFPDHHWYSDSDVLKIVETRNSFNADAIVTTEKDAVRLGRLYDKYLTSENLFVAEVQQKIIAGEEKLLELLNRVAN